MVGKEIPETIVHVSAEAQMAWLCTVESPLLSPVKGVKSGQRQWKQQEAVEGILRQIRDLGQQMGRPRKMATGSDLLQLFFKVLL